MDLLNMIHPDSCKAGIEGTTKNELLENLADLVMKHPAAANVDKQVLLKNVHQREEKGSTGIGNQIAIPHSEVPGLDDFIIALATSQKGVDFEAIDNKKSPAFLYDPCPSGRGGQSP